jgi:Tfp pilus assembly protein PilF
MRARALFGLAVVGSLGGSVGLAACPLSAHDREKAQIHYDLGVNAMEQAHDAPSALRELEISAQANPDNPEVHNAMGLVYHLMLHKPEEAVAQYQLALKLSPKFSEAANNLGTALLDLDRYSEAAEMFKRALADDLYRTPYMAEGNLGWVLYKSGDTVGGIQHLKAAIGLNVGYCQGYRLLGKIYQETSQLADAETQFIRFHDKCPDVPEASYLLGLVLLKEDQQERAKQQFQACADAKESKDTDLGAECARMIKLMQ